MASTTKIMTALIACECGDVDREVRINDAAVGIEGSSIYLTKGEVLTLRQLVYALMLASANDAATAIAYEIGGSIEGFARLMNDRARQLGLTSTHFTNPHGLHDAEHYTTAYELAKITQEALKNKIFREICSSKNVALPFGDGDGTRYIANHNKLLKSYSGAIGVKTGFTKASGRCLVSAAERDGLCLIAVTLNAPDDWRDHTSLLDFGFSNYKRLKIADSGEFTVSLHVAGGEPNEVIASNAVPLEALLHNRHGSIEYTVEAARPIYAPVTRSKVIGKIVVSCDGREICSSPLVCVTGSEQKKTGLSLWERIREIFS